MEVKEYFKLRTDLIEESIDEDGVFSKEGFLSNILPDLVETKLLDSEDFTPSYFNGTLDKHKLKINGYTINETGERLQIFILNEDATSLKVKETELIIKLKEVYQNLFSEGLRFIKSSVKRHLELQDSDPASFLVHNLGNSNFMKLIDVVEIFVISPTLTVEARGLEMSTKQMEFRDEYFTINYTVDREKRTKEILVDKKLIDLNYLYDISISNGAKYALKVDFSEYFDRKIEVLKAADEKNFESYLCVLPAEGLAKLYKKNSTRLLEKNVRSFLNFKVEANSEMRKTIRNEPEKFIAYNNGLTITATDKDLIEENGRYYLQSLTDFQIVNGGQTTASIFFSKRDNLDVSKINLMAKINIAKDLSEEDLNDLISNISLYSNTQSKVSKVDLKSRNPQMDKIKIISLGVTTPLGYKWFFEKSRGEFSTMVKLSGANKKKIEQKFPRQRRLTKVDLGKYYTAWGNQPWLVKKGGEKVFRFFIEKLSGDGEKIKSMDVNREFYEELIAKAILFRELEILHGARSAAIGQLRSAVVPYSLSILFEMFGGTDKRTANFNLEKIWVKQKIDDALLIFMKELMILLYTLIKKYASSDDLGENTKKEVLWLDISKSLEIKNFTSTPDAIKIISLFTAEKKKKKVYKEVDFSHISDSVDLIAKGKAFYDDLYSKLSITDKEIDFKPETFRTCTSSMFPSGKAPKDLSDYRLKYIKRLLNEIREKAPEIYDNVEENKSESALKITLDKIIEKYNNVITEKSDIRSEFDALSELANHKKIDYASSIASIGRKLANGESPLLKELHQASNYFALKQSFKKKNVKAEIVSDQYSESIHNSSNLKYCKLICNQDLNRTPSVGRNIVENFFNLNLEHGESKQMLFSFKDENFEVEINKRKTRSEYRFFLNRVRDKIGFNVDDILVVSREEDVFFIEILRNNNVEQKSDYYKTLEKMNGKLHALL